MAKIVIIGAGLTGLSTAYHLEQLGFHDYLLFEKEATVGGLCRSVQQDGFTFDYTGHLLHVSDPYFKSFIESVVGLEHLNTIARRSFVYSQDTYTRYPYQVNLHGLPPQTITECITDFTQRTIKKSPKNFHDWVLSNFGAGFAKYFFFPYQEKIFDYPVTKLSASWTGRFVPETSLPSMIMGALRDNEDTSIGYNANFFYPKEGGIYFWIDQLYRQLKNPVHTDHCVKKIDLKNKRITFTNGAEVAFETLISTMPLDILLNQLEEKSDTTLFRAAQKLLCNSVVNFNIGINQPNLSERHWVYYPEKQYPFYRIGFPHNFATSMAPKSHSSLYGEFSYLQKPKEDVEQMLTHAITATKKLFAISDADIVTEKIIHIKHAYVIYNSWRDKHLQKIHDQLNAQHVYSIGRYGQWKYSSMQEGLLEGKEIAEKLTKNMGAACI